MCVALVVKDGARSQRFSDAGASRCGGTGQVPNGQELMSGNC
ncbi:MAG: hypothetical protein RBU37_07955 [Myxococcota bacterium]|nr:hypothetical protein [Myxococcota bacterium]